MDEVAVRFERNFTMLGATAVEDSLQEGAGDTIESLRRAGIKVGIHFEEGYYNCYSDVIVRGISGN